MKDLLKENFKYIVLGLSLILFAFIIWWSLYYVEKNKSESIEKQKSWELNQEQQKIQQLEDKLSIEKKEYSAKRSKECNDIYYNETKRFNNVLWANYDSVRDKCVVSYKSTILCLTPLNVPDVSLYKASHCIDDFQISNKEF